MAHTAPYLVGKAEAFDYCFDIFAVVALAKTGYPITHRVRGDEAHPQSNLFRAGDLQTLTSFDGRNILARILQTVEGTRVEPGKAAAKSLNIEETRGPYTFRSAS